MRLAEPPPFDIARVSHVELGCRDLGAARAFYADGLGLAVTAEQDGSIYLRAPSEGGHHALVLTHSTEAVVHRVGFRVETEEDLDKAAWHLAHGGFGACYVERPWQATTLGLTDPLGMPIEFVFGMSLAEAEGARRVGSVQALDHVACTVPDVAVGGAFYESLGFTPTEQAEGGPGRAPLTATWLRRKSFSYDLSFRQGAGPALHHVGLRVGAAGDLLACCDRLGWLALGSLEWGPGRHGVGDALFLYLRDPDGHRIGLFWSDRLGVDPDREPIRWAADDPARDNLWGQPAPASWAEGSSPCASSALLAEPAPA
jgi:catechol 2,3-dioxygenase